MQKHTKIYLKWLLGYIPDYQDEIIYCEICGKPAQDLHHIIYKSQQGKDELNNIIALCREDHEKAHKGEHTKEYLQEIHKRYIKLKNLLK
jgi:5-methylcytosine-specific restriction endonuclease McrA